MNQIILIKYFLNVLFYVFLYCICLSENFIRYRNYLIFNYRKNIFTIFNLKLQILSFIFSQNSKNDDCFISSLL